jgi:2-haloacid dehalogenase
MGRFDDQTHGMDQSLMNKWISFDCYGTLIDWRTGLSSSLDIVAPGRGRDLLGLHRKVEGEIEINEPYQSYREVLAESVRRMAGCCDVKLGPGDEHILSATLPFWPVYPDTNGALRELKAQGWKLAILSNVDRDLIAGTLRHFEVLFDLVITAQDVRSYKPAPMHAHRFLQATEVRPENWIYAAVSNQYDLVPGHQLGANCVWINRDQEASQNTEFLLANLGGMADLPAAAAAYLSQRNV